jgi:hypothetical protein
MEILLSVVVFGGYLLPLPSLGMTWREWIVGRKVLIKTWRSLLTLATLVLTTAIVPLWAYAVVRELRHDYSYIFASAQFGRWSSLLLIVMAVFTVGKVRPYILLTLVGVLFFFAFSIGELP